jgi:hypothetical protein
MMNKSFTSSRKGRDGEDAAERTGGVRGSIGGKTTTSLDELGILGRRQTMPGSPAMGIAPILDLRFSPTAPVKSVTAAMPERWFVA